MLAACIFDTDGATEVSKYVDDASFQLSYSLVYLCSKNAIFIISGEGQR